MSLDGIPTENGRVLNLLDTSENPTFLPGDKVRDRRDRKRRTWRIVRRVGYTGRTELITLREVADYDNEYTLPSDQLIPYLEMVAMWKDKIIEEPKQ